MTDLNLPDRPASPGATSGANWPLLLAFVVLVVALYLGVDPTYVVPPFFALQPGQRQPPTSTNGAAE